VIVSSLLIEVVNRHCATTDVNVYQNNHAFLHLMSYRVRFSKHCSL